MSPGQEFTLREHGAAVTATDSTVHDGNVMFVSGDSEGWIVWWDIGLKRPRKKWKGHDSNIIAIQIIDSKRFLSQSKDSSVKIWNFSSIGKDAVSPSMEIPINSLNFCNVVYHYPYLFTPASIDSNNFDMYTLEEDGNGYDFSRIIANCNPHELYTHQSNIIEMPSDLDVARSGFGIIMRLGYINEYNVLYLGFESGHILAINIDIQAPKSSSTLTKTSIDRTIINKEPKLKVVYYNSSHTPNPIISLIESGNNLISGSTNKKIISHDYSHDKLLHEHKLNHSGIQCISKYKSGFVVGYWNGVIEGLILDSKNPFFTIKREIPRVRATESSLTSVNEGSKDTKDSMKLTSISVIELSNQISTIGKSYKELIKSKRSGILANDSLLMVGYEDGTIIAFK